jgi:hypothetical protein
VQVKAGRLVAALGLDAGAHVAASRHDLHLFAAPNLQVPGVVGLAIMGTREMAFGLLRYALSRFGLPDDRVQAIVQAARASGEGGAFEREPEIELPDAAPELRERNDDDGRS